jgi:hypothetical protein
MSLGAHGPSYVHRENILLNLLMEGLEKLTYPEVLKALAQEDNKP